MRFSRNREVTLLAAGLVLLAVSPGLTEGPASYEEAKRLAADRGVPLVVDFYTEH